MMQPLGTMSHLAGTEVIARTALACDAAARMAVRFWSKVALQPGDECWAWRGSHDRTGYGVVRLDGRLYKAHRVAWLLTHGEDPGPRLWHRCDNPGCVRPGHLSVAGRRRQARRAGGGG